MGTAERRRRDKENLQRAILDAARALFVSDGYDSVTMRKIANAIEYSPTTIYSYFKDKEEILWRLKEEGFALLAAQMATIQDEEPVGRLRKCGHIYYNFALSQTQYYTIMFQLKAADIQPIVCTPPEITGYDCFKFLIDTIEAGIQQGTLKATHPIPILAYFVFASLHGAASLTLSGRVDIVPKEHQPGLVDAVMDSILDALQAEKTA